MHNFFFFFGVPHLATCIFLFFYNEPELGVGINPGMALTPLPSSIGQTASNPRTSDREPSALPLDHSFRLLHNFSLLIVCVCIFLRKNSGENLLV